MSVFNPSLTGKVSLIVRRYTKGTRAKNGSYIPGGSTTFNIIANHQPLTDEEMLLLPEAKRQKQVRKVYTASELKPVDVENDIKADEINIDGSEYVVFKVQNYNMGVLDHFKAIVVREDQ